MFKHALLLLILFDPQNGPTPVIDGRLGEAEWAGARRADLLDGGEVQLLGRGEFLFVLVRGPHPGLATLCVAKGKTVRVLHASAAIGDAAFERWGDMWMKRKGFEWTLRDSRRDGPPSDQAKEQWLASSGWLANASASGAREREFKIAAKDVEAIGVTFFATDGTNAISYWPSTMNDDCRAVKIAQGYLPDTARFEPATWYRLK